MMEVVYWLVVELETFLNWKPGIKQREMKNEAHPEETESNNGIT